MSNDERRKDSGGMKNAKIFRFGNTDGTAGGIDRVRAGTNCNARTRGNHCANIHTRANANVGTHGDTCTNRYPSRANGNR